MNGQDENRNKYYQNPLISISEKTPLALSILNYPKEISYFWYECSLFNLKKSKQDKNTNRDDNKFPRR